MGSFVGLKHNKQWIWLALDSDSREIVWMHVGSRDHAGAEALWKSFPPVYRQCAVCYTDFWSAYEQVLPQNRHRTVGKESGKMLKLPLNLRSLHIKHYQCRKSSLTPPRRSYKRDPGSGRPWKHHPRGRLERLQWAGGHGLQKAFPGASW